MQMPDAQTPKAKGAKVLHRTIAPIRAGDGAVLHAVCTEEGRGMVFFAQGMTPERVTAAAGTTIDEIRSISNALVLLVRLDGTDVNLLVDGDPLSLPMSTGELAPLAHLNCALAIRNGEDPDTLRDWLQWHVDRQNMQAALILDRTPPNEGCDFLTQVERAAKGIRGLQRVVVVQFDHPLGQAGLPDESDPFCAPDAPGKDRMTPPAPDPWRAPLGQVQVYEILRYQFLDQARAVAQIDLSDLVMRAPDAPSIFDAAYAAPSGCVGLAGRHAFPWRIRKGAKATFADHICVQFDAANKRKRWCIAPSVSDSAAVWRMVRVGHAEPRDEDWFPFVRCMALRHPGQSVARIVPKTSLVEDDSLLALAKDHFDHKPVRMPELARPKVDPDKDNSVAVITCMKNEGPFILEWVAYHRAIGVTDFLVYTNDCSDGTDSFLDLLQSKGILQHRDNPFKGTGLKPQHAALQAGEQEPVIKNADWVVSMDVDEFINVKVGDGTLDALFKAAPKANMIAMTWRLFGNSDIHGFTDAPLIGDFTRCAPEMTRKPHQAWGFKTLFRNIGIFKKLGVHRPKGLNPQLWDEIHWVNGSGRRLPKELFRNAWRSTLQTVGYEMVQLNHYAVRSAESFLVKRDRGRVNHVDRDQGLAYWFRMNHNTDEDLSIKRMLPALQAEMDRLLEDPDIAAAHNGCVQAHRAKIDTLKATENYAKFYADLTGPRMERLARMHHHFGSNVFLAGPDVVPDELVEKDHPNDFFFTVERQETSH